MINFLSRIGLSIISFLFHRKIMAYEEKLKILNQIIGYRFVLVKEHQGCYKQQEGEFFTAINRIPIVFANSKNVLSEFHVFRGNVNLKMLTILVKKICEELKISPDSIRLDEIFESPINPSWNAKNADNKETQ